MPVQVFDMHLCAHKKTKEIIISKEIKSFFKCDLTFNSDRIPLTLQDFTYTDTVLVSDWLPVKPSRSHFIHLIIPLHVCTAF